MPTSGGGWYGFWEANPRKWERCISAAGAAMIADGWHPQARKFSEVRRKRAYKLWMAE